MADIKKQKKSIKDKKKRDVLLSFGDKAMEFGQKHAALIIASVAAVVIGIFVIVIMHHTAVANEAKASDDLAAFKREMNAARTADAALLAADKLETLRGANKGNKTLYPNITYDYARCCYDAGIYCGNAELLQRSIKACNDLLDNYPRAQVTQMKDPETGENLVTRLRDNAQKALDGLNALDTEVQWGDEDLPPLEPETPGGPAPVGEGT
jgi:hypothetical protein